MFVKTHSGHGGHSGCVMILNRGDTENVHCVDSYGVCKIPIKEFNTNFEPITFKCPHCNTEIQQAERVECSECHAVYRAIDEEMLEFMFKKIPVTMTTSKDLSAGEYRHLEFAFRSVNDVGDEISECILVWKINSIHFLEIKAAEK